jgi:two-component system OmpR family sensor kinase
VGSDTGSRPDSLTVLCMLAHKRFTCRAASAQVWSPSLRSRLSRAVLLVALLSLVAAFGAFFTASSVLHNALDRDIEEAVYLLETSASSRAIPDPSALPSRYVVRIADATSRTLASTASDVDLSQLSDGWHDISSYRVLQKQLRGGNTLTVGLSTKPLTQALRVALVAFLSGTVAVIIFLSMTMMRVYRTGAKPLIRMTETAEDVTSGNMTARVNDVGLPLEAYQLASAINRLLEAQTRARRAEEHVLEEQQRFLQDASHELRNPLATIRGWAELLATGSVPVSRQNEAYSRILHEASRMTRLTEQLLTLSRLERAATSLQDALDARTEVSDLSSIVSTCVADHTVRDALRPVKLVVPQTPVLCLGSSDALHQVVSNLLTNLSVHTPIGTTASLTLREDTASVTLLYEDDGPGVPDTSLVFDRFYQADPSRVGAGTGLGLSLVEALIGSAGGDVRAFRTSPGGFGLEVSLRPSVT